MGIVIKIIGKNVINYFPIGTCTLPTTEESSSASADILSVMHTECSHYVFLATLAQKEPGYILHLKILYYTRYPFFLLKKEQRAAVESSCLQ